MNDANRSEGEKRRAALIAELDRLIGDKAIAEANAAKERRIFEALRYWVLHDGTIEAKTWPKSGDALIDYLRDFCREAKARRPNANGGPAK